MRFRVKLYLAFIAVAAITSGAGELVLYIQAKRLMLRELAEKVASIGVTTAGLINGDELQKVLLAGDPHSPSYLQLQSSLRAVRDANNRAGTNVRDIYTLFPAPYDPRILLFGVDAESDPNYAAEFGEVFDDPYAKPIEKNPDKVFAPKEIYQDRWGVWLSAYAPIYNSQGHYVASLGVDLSAQDVYTALHRLHILSFISLGASMLLAALVAQILSKRASASLSTLNRAVQEIGAGRLKTKVELTSKDEFADLAMAIAQMTKGLEERERLKTNFARYVSHHVLEKVLESEALGQIQSERRKVTLLFSDIRHFTKLAETMSPEAVVSLLNEYFEHMLDVIFANFGTLDKFLGDGIMVEFGAPLDDNMQEQHAIVTALGMQEKLRSLREKWASEGKPPIEMGIGIHTGTAVVGNIGSEERLEYTAIGDTVNVAARLEQSTKLLKVAILASEQTVTPVKELFVVENLGAMTVAGRSKEIVVYSILGRKRSTLLHPLP